MKFPLTLLKRLAGEHYVIMEPDHYRILRALEIWKNADAEALAREVELAKAKLAENPERKLRELEKREQERIWAASAVEPPANGLRAYLAEMAERNNRNAREVYDIARQMRY